MDLILQLKIQTRFHVKEQLKMYNRVKKDAFDVAHDSALEGTSKRTSKGARKGAIRNLHKDPREDAFECVNKGALSKKCT